MGKLTVAEFVTLDGVFEDPGEVRTLDRGGWAFEIPPDDEQMQVQGGMIFEADVLLFGRNTYEGFAEAWPEREGPMAEKMNSVEKVVVSTTLDEAEWRNSRVIRNDLAGEVARIKEEGKTILVPGSGKLVDALLDQGLVDEYQIMVFPVVLGKGRRLFDAERSKASLKLIGTRSFDSGVVLITYVPG